MTAQPFKFTIHNTGTQALKFTDAGGVGSVYVSPGMWQDLTLAKGSPKLVELVANSVVPLGGGGRPEESL